MSRINTHITKIQDKLHDKGSVWSRSELVKWFNDGYRIMLAKSHASKRLVCMDVPPRFGTTITYPWEARYAKGAVWSPFFSIKNGSAQTTYRWEAEQAEGITPTNSKEFITHPWERSYISGDADQHFQFALPQNTEMIKRVAWDDERLDPITVRELDMTRDAWFSRDGEPNWWTTGTGRNNTIEIFELETSYFEAYDLGDQLYGLPRSISGTRTYSTEVSVDHPGNFYAFTSNADIEYLENRPTAFHPGLGWRFTQDASDNDRHGTQVWEKEMDNGVDSDDFTDGATVGTYEWEKDYGAQNITFAVGSVREISSSNRQYLPIASHTGEFFVNGTIRNFKSTENSVSVLESIVPDISSDEGDIPDLIPSQMEKYVRYYVLSRAYGHMGEGHNPVLAEHYEFRFNRGIEFMKRLANLSSRDREFQRGPERRHTGRPPRVQLPSNYPRVLF